jgi:hypothetical protein
MKKKQGLASLQERRRCMDTMGEYRARQEAAAARESAAFSAGQSGSGFGGGSFLEMQAWERGRALSSGGGGGGGGGLSPIVLPFLAIMAVGFWPLCGALTLGAGLGTAAALGLALPGLGGGWAALAGLAAGIAGLVFGWKVEQRLAVSRPYRVLRHFLRLAWLGMLFVYVALQMSYGGVYNVWPDDITLEWIDSKLSPGAYIMILIGIVLTHFVSRRFDDLIEQRADPERAAKRQVDRAVRWRRMKITFVVAGAIGAACAAVYGDAAGGIVATFFVFGMVATFLYWGGSRVAAAFRS